MPPKRSKKAASKKGSKAAAAAAAVEPPKDAEIVEENAAPNIADAAQEFSEKVTLSETVPDTSDVQEPAKAMDVEEAGNAAVEKVQEVAEAIAEKVKDVAEAAQQFAEKMDGVVEESSKESEAEGSKSTMTMEERKAKMEQLRKKMHSNSLANRASLVEESAKQKMNARELARLERQRKLAETLRQKADAEDRGEDVERQKNWEWTIEENDEWEKKQARKARRADFEFHDDAHAARRRYKKDLDLIKPDLATYNRQKEQALGLAPGTLVKGGPSGEGSSALANFDPSSGNTAVQVMPTTDQQRIAAEGLYRDANTLLYADNKPSDEAIDRVVDKLNRDQEKKGKFSRKRANEEEGDITYINERNRVFNKKIARYYDKYTTEIRASFERGTAL